MMESASFICLAVVRREGRVGGEEGGKGEKRRGGVPGAASHLEEG